MHANGKIVAVWLDKDCKEVVEDESFYQKVYDMQIDMLTTDFPQEANYFLAKYHQFLKTKQSKTEI